LARIPGADAATLTQAVAKHAVAPAYTPLSWTDQSPAKASNVVPSALQDNERKESPDELNARLRLLMNQTNVVLFMKGSPEEPRCGFSRKISALLKEKNVEFSHFDILSDESVRQGMWFPFLLPDGVALWVLSRVMSRAEGSE